ncbi:ATP-dependent zinc metalloprotease FtsH [Planctomycetales bacterium 10988]|nr:ATP-dependent zinc metalloprotease FtsH [Planctomycetales bacterium 10988]
MTLAEQLSEYVRACFTGIWIESHEHADALSEMAELCREEGWQFGSWNIESGLRVAGQSTEETNSIDPLSAIRSVNAMSTPEGTAILVLENFHRFLQSAEIVQALSRQILLGKQNRTILVILSPLVQLPVELEKMFVVLSHALPGREQLDEIAQGIATEEGEYPEGRDRERILDAASGLTRLEAENAFSLSLVREGSIEAETIWELKAQTLKKCGALSLCRSEENFESLGGLGALKTFCRRSLLQPSRANPHKRAKGVLLLGVPGVGKSAFCRSLGKEVGRPTITLDVGSLYGSLVGETERKIRQALVTIDAMEPSIVLLDEIEKAFSGLGSSGQTDSGVSSRLFGTFLQWLSDHESDVYVVASCNDISKLPPEFSRSERWDGLFFLDLPGRDEKDLIWELYRSQYEMDPNQQLPSDDLFTGAEIKATCRLAALLDLPLSQAVQNVVPVAVTASESIERLRNWASGRCLDASQPGIYRCMPNHSQSTRSISRTPSNN